MLFEQKSTDDRTNRDQDADTFHETRFLLLSQASCTCVYLYVALQHIHMSHGKKSGTRFYKGPVVVATPIIWSNFTNICLARSG